MKKSKIVRGYEIIKSSEKSMDHAVELSRKIRNNIKNKSKIVNKSISQEIIKVDPENLIRDTKFEQNNDIIINSSTASFSRLNAKLYRYAILYRTNIIPNYIEFSYLNFLNYTLLSYLHTALQL